MVESRHGTSFIASRCHHHQVLCIDRHVVRCVYRVRHRGAGLRMCTPHVRPIRLTCLFSEGGEVIKLRTEGSLTIPTTGITMGMLKNSSSSAAGSGGWYHYPLLSYGVRMLAARLIDVVRWFAAMSYSRATCSLTPTRHAPCPAPSPPHGTPPALHPHHHTACPTPLGRKRVTC